jgi:LPS-assembly lipoprotein
MHRPDRARIRIGAVSTAAVFLCSAVLLAQSLVGCGFHLRGASSAALPPELSTLRVTMGSGYPPLLVDMRNALQTLGNVRVTEDVSAKVPVLQLLSESSVNQLLAIDSSGRPSAYILNYRVDFSLTGADGKPLLEKQSVKLQREYSFDRLNVIATEKQSDFLQSEMRRDAVQQILRRLASLNVAHAAEGHADQP